MTITLSDMLLYAGALLILFLTPGPVWVALIARSLAGGFQGAWPLALGVVVAATAARRLLMAASARHMYCPFDRAAV